MPWSALQGGSWTHELSGSPADAGGGDPGRRADDRRGRALSGLPIDTFRYYEREYDEREGLTASPADRAPSGQRRYFALTAIERKIAYYRKGATSP
ncbi:hypothetical protein ACIO1C_03340 [Streptomyces sp. NPDC087420]|uniref:hypothetical protein n=1 Tax=Streptomyces sp. NPDC087420 TaxID=3365785 RepID=UPI0038358693